uniref:Uncharacterized protein n=1 Tax=Arundo donax TaxID=35708 RepID=A0A0A9HH24_ARUDO
MSQVYICAYLLCLASPLGFDILNSEK